MAPGRRDACFRRGHCVFLDSPHHWGGVGIRSRNSPFRERGNPCPTLARRSRIVAPTSTPVSDFPSVPMLAISLFLSRPSFSSVRSPSASWVATPSREDPDGAPANSIGSRISFAAWEAHQIFEHTSYWPPCILGRIAMVATPWQDMHRVPSECGTRPLGHRAPRIFVADAVYFGPRNLSWATRRWRLGRKGASFRRIALHSSSRASRWGQRSVVFFGFAFRRRRGLRVFRGKGCAASAGRGRAAFMAALRGLFLRLADSLPIMRRLRDLKKIILAGSQFK